MAIINFSLAWVWPLSEGNSYLRVAFINFRPIFDISELDLRLQTTPTSSMHTVGVETERNQILSLASNLGLRQIRGEQTSS